MCILREERKLEIRESIVNAYRNSTPTKEELSKHVSTCAKNGVILVEGNRVVIQYFSDMIEEMTITEDSYVVRPTTLSEVFPEEFTEIKYNPM